jgi:hypothetical protein
MKKIRAILKGFFRQDWETLWESSDSWIEPNLNYERDLRLHDKAEKTITCFFTFKIVYSPYLNKIRSRVDYFHTENTPIEKKMAHLSAKKECFDRTREYRDKLIENSFTKVF